MKKVTRIIGAICMMGLLTFVSTSCKKEKESETTLNVVVSGFEAEDEGERAYINSSYQFMWHESDHVRVYNLADEANADESVTSIFDKVGNASTSSARFRGPSVGAKKAEGYRVFYPVGMVKYNNDEDMINATLWNENRQIFEVKKQQQFEYYNTTEHPHPSRVDGQAMPMAVDMEDLTKEAELKQIFGVAAFLLQKGPEYTGEIVIDSVKVIDNYHNLTGEVSVKLHDVFVDSLRKVSDAFFEEYQGFTDEYVDKVVTPALNNIGWIPTKTGKEVTLNCCYKHADGEVKGEALGNGETNFAILLRPLALSNGFTLLVYIEGRPEPVELTDLDFYRHDINHYLDYTWAIKSKVYKTYRMRTTLDVYL
jgi:hypothetical protein